MKISIKIRVGTDDLDPILQWLEVYAEKFLCYYQSDSDASKHFFFEAEVRNEIDLTVFKLIFQDAIIDIITRPELESQISKLKSDF